MKDIQSNKSLKAFNTFGIDCIAKHFISIERLQQLKDVLSQKTYPKLFILGGGNNMLLTQNIDALVAHINLKGITVISEVENQVVLHVMAGENWHEFVMYCIDNNYGGVENLSLIPGNVGTAPIQNIGAYGVELQNVFESCTAIDKETGEEVLFLKSDCEFGYRDSIFKNKASNAYVISSVNFRLTTKDHKLHTSYGAIGDFLKDEGIDAPTIADVSKAVIAIRQSKLPDPNELGNSGSFFKNPIIGLRAFQEFQSNHPNAPFYEVSTTEFKIPAGWLIEQAGFKGKRYGDAGVHSKQALVLVNYGNATGSELWELALRIQKKVNEDFNILLEPEVNVI